MKQPTSVGHKGPCEARCSPQLIPTGRSQPGKAQEGLQLLRLVSELSLHPTCWAAPDASARCITPLDAISGCIYSVAANV